MSRSLNKTLLIGNVGNDPEIRSTTNGARIAKLSLATNRSWNNAAGQPQEKTEWHRLTVFGKLVDIVEQWVKKGDRLYVEGRIEYGSYEKEGVTHYTTDITVNEIVMLGSNAGSGAETPSDRGRQLPPEPAPSASSDPDDDLPF